jgi:hypothetical protein
VAYTRSYGTTHHSTECTTDEQPDLSSEFAAYVETKYATFGTTYWSTEHATHRTTECSTDWRAYGAAI